MPTNLILSLTVKSERMRRASWNLHCSNQQKKEWRPQARTKFAHCEVNDLSVSMSNEIN